MGEFDHIVAALQASPVVAAFQEMAVSNDFSRLDRNAAKRHHFLPQFLLRGFAHAHQGKARLFQMETATRRAPLRVDVRNAASRRRLYTAVGEDGRCSNRIEGYLALVETHAAAALRHLISDPASLSPGERATIALLVALQTMRTPVAAEQVTAIANTALKMVASEFLSDRHAFADRYRKSFDDATEAEIERFRQKTLDQIRDGQVRLTGRDGAAFATGLQQAAKNAFMLIAFHWTLLRSPSGGLITSDRGYAIYDPTPPYPWASPGLLSSENTEVTVPLSDTVCLLMRPVPGNGGLAVHEVSADDIEILNLRAYGWADNYVFAKTQAALDAVRLGSRRRSARVIRPHPLSNVALLELDSDDNSLAEANLRRRWPAQLRNERGELRDYIVIPDDLPHAELWKLADELAEHRGRKRAGIGATEPIEARIIRRQLAPTLY